MGVIRFIQVIQQPDASGQIFGDQLVGVGQRARDSALTATDTLRPDKADGLFYFRGISPTSAAAARPRAGRLEALERCGSALGYAGSGRRGYRELPGPHA